jgi:microcystin-dependent protein
MSGMGFAGGGIDVGAVFLWPTATNHPGETSGAVVPADGRNLSRTAYAALFALWGTTHGAGDGSTTFGVPDYRGRAVIGAGQGAGLTNRAVGQTGGAEVHALSAAEMPAHSHPVNGLFVGTGTTYAAGGLGKVQTNGTTDSQGGGGAHNNMPPFAVARILIKAR